MIDIHCHILPGIDDGAQDIEMSLEMAKQAVKEGIKTIVATPHHKNGSFENQKHEILRHVESLNDALQLQNIPLTILPGQENRIYGELLEDYELGQILTVNNTGKYILVEFPSNHVPRYTEKLLYDIQLEGITPVIVHPERNSEIIENPDILFNLVKKGALSQVTAGSIAGGFGKKIQRFSMQLIESNLTHMVASDAHNLKGRSFKMTEALDVIEKEFGMDLVYMFHENGELMIEGKTVYRDEPSIIKKKKFLGIF